MSRITVSEIKDLQSGVIKNVSDLLEDADISTLDSRVTTAEGEIDTLQSDVSSLQTDKTDLQSSSVTFKVPTDYATLQAAFDDLSERHGSGDTEIEILIETGHQLTNGLLLVRGDFSRFAIRSEDATVSLDAAFVGVDSPSVYESVTHDDLFSFWNCHSPVLDCVIDMSNLYDRGMIISHGSTAVINPSAGVTNAGTTGLSVRGSQVFANESVWDGANHEGIRLEQAAVVSANGSSCDNCMKDTGTSGRDSAVFASRACVLNFMSASAQSSGKEGLRAQRSIINANNSNFSNATGEGIICQHGSRITAQGSTITGCGAAGVVLRHGAYLTLVSAVVKDNSGNDINLGDVGGGQCWATGCETTSSSVSSDFPDVSDTSQGSLNTISSTGFIVG